MGAAWRALSTIGGWAVVPVAVVVTRVVVGGRRFLKDEDLGFLAEPYVSEPFHVEPGQHAYLVLASDGWVRAGAGTQRGT